MIVNVSHSGLTHTSPASKAHFQKCYDCVSVAKATRAARRSRRTWKPSGAIWANWQPTRLTARCVHLSTAAAFSTFCSLRGFLAERLWVHCDAVRVGGARTCCTSSCSGRRTLLTSGCWPRLLCCHPLTCTRNLEPVVHAAGTPAVHTLWPNGSVRHLHSLDVGRLCSSDDVGFHICRVLGSQQMCNPTSRLCRCNATRKC